MNRELQQIKFGYWPRAMTLRAGSIVVEPLPDYQQTVESLGKEGRVANGWFYPPLRTARHPKTSTETPRIYESVYQLTLTHRIVVRKSARARELAEFLIAALGLIEGLRLLPEGWVHFYRAAVKPHMLSDVDCTRQDLEAVLLRAEAFWREATAEIRRLMLGAVHWRLFAESYEHEFERFSGQYTVFDTCWKLLELLEPGWLDRDMNNGKIPKRLRAWASRRSHAVRPALISRHFRMAVPSWARVRKSRSKNTPECRLSDLRNEFIHEGLYGRRPIGFGHPKNFKGSIDFQLAAFNTRLILALLGVNCQYSRSSAETHCAFALDRI